MKRKLFVMVLSVALTLTLIPTLAAYADDALELGGPTDQMIEDVDANQDEPDSDIDEEDTDLDEGDIEDGDVDKGELEDGDVDEGEAVEVELPKINLKSPVTQLSQSEIGTQVALVARVGSEVIDPIRITWTSGDESIATVSEAGVVTIVGVGKVSITAAMTDESARSGYAKMFVFADKTKPEVEDQNDTIIDQDIEAPESNKGKSKHK